MSFDISQLVIEKGVPVPVPNTCQRNPLYEFLQGLQVSDSVVLPIPRDKVPTRLYKLDGMRFKTRRVDQCSTRVWRVA